MGSRKAGRRLLSAAASGLPVERFPSKRDGWLVALLWGASAVDFVIAAWLGLGFGGGAAPAWLAPWIAAAGGFQLHVLYGTHYTLAGEALLVRASFLRWRIPLAAIDSLEPSRNPLSSPACSLDRLLIRYGGKRILISPEDKEGFLRALAGRAPQLEASGAGLQRRKTV